MGLWTAIGTYNSIKSDRATRKASEDDRLSKPQWLVNDALVAGGMGMYSAAQEVYTGEKNDAYEALLAEGIDKWGACETIYGMRFDENIPPSP